MQMGRADFQVLPLFVSLKLLNLQDICVIWKVQEKQQEKYMGKQINYYMGYEDFLSVAQAALDSDCIIYRRSSENGRFELISGTTLDTIKPNCDRYYFHNPAIGNFDIGLISEKQYIPMICCLTLLKQVFQSQLKKNI